MTCTCIASRATALMTAHLNRYGRTRGESIQASSSTSALPSAKSRERVFVFFSPPRRRLRPSRLRREPLEPESVRFARASSASPASSSSDDLFALSSRSFPKRARPEKAFHQLNPAFALTKSAGAARRKFGICFDS